MKIIVYVDESSRTQGRHAGNLIMGGFISTAEQWDKLRIEWQTTLDKYSAKYFHFRELDPNERRKSDCHFHNWSGEKVDDFIHDLAEIAGRLAIPCGSCKNLVPPGHTNYRSDTWKQTYDLFLDNFLYVANMHWPAFEGAQFIFDNQENTGMLGQLNNAIQEHRKIDPRIPSNYTFGSLTEEIPLQAADMLAYTLGQSGENAFKEGSRQHLRIIDCLLFKNQFPKGHQFAWPDPSQINWLERIRKYRAHKKVFDAQRKARGLKKTPYFPSIHYPSVVI